MEEMNVVRISRADFESNPRQWSRPLVRAQYDRRTGVGSKAIVTYAAKTSEWLGQESSLRMNNGHQLNNESTDNDKLIVNKNAVREFA